MKKKIKVKYNGRRFPKIVQIRGGVNKSFQPGREALVLDEYDALLLLKSNVRLAADKWAMTVMPSVDKSTQETTDALNAKIEELEAKIEAMNKADEPADDEPDTAKNPEAAKKEEDNKQASSKKTKQAMKK